jgi:hypothetical protein
MRAVAVVRRQALKAVGAVERFQREARTAAMLSHTGDHKLGII